MTLRNNHERYGTLSVSLHWLMAVMLIAIYVTMNLHESFPKGSAMRSGLKTWHYMLGLSVLVLALFRFVWNMMSTAPSIVPTPPKWQTMLAKLMHLALYALMIAMPIAGWLILSGEGDPIPFWGLELPALMAPNESLADAIQEAHEAGATIGYFLIGLHAIAGLYHHYVVRDNTLRRMLPQHGKE